ALGEARRAAPSDVGQRGRLGDGLGYGGGARDGAAGEELAAIHGRSPTGQRRAESTTVGNPVVYCRRMRSPGLTTLAAVRPLICRSLSMARFARRAIP